MTVPIKTFSYLQYKFHCTNYSCRNIFSLFRRGIHNLNPSDVPRVSLSEIKKQLRLHNYIVEDGFACLLTKCPICKATNKSNIGNAYINKITGFFQCPSCDNSGPWNAVKSFLRRRSGATTELPEGLVHEASFKDTWSNLETSSTAFSDTSENHAQELLSIFNLPPVPDACTTLSSVRVTSDYSSLLFPLSDVGGKFVGCISATQHSNGASTTLPIIGCSGILVFRLERKTSQHPPIIVNSLKDALSVIAQNVPGGAICLPYGMSSLPQQALPSLEKWSKLILWGPSDAMMAIAQKLGHSRCLPVRPTESHPLPHEALMSGCDLKVIAAAARPMWHKAITTFNSLREDVLSDLHNVEKVQGIKWKRYPALSRLLRGHRRGELTVLTGPTGCGKTTFCSEYSLDLALQGVNTLWGSFEIRNARLARTMLQQLAGFPLEENLQQFNEIADSFEKLPIYFLMFHGQQSIKDVMEAVEHAVYVHDIAHVIIDNVQFMLGLGDEPTRNSDRFWRQDAVVAAFRGLATRSNIHVTLVMHPRKERVIDELSTSSIFGSAKASQEADNVLIIQDRRLTAVRGKKYLQVAKNRYSGDLGIMPLEFNKAGLSYATRKKEDHTHKQETKGSEVS